jgi:hypothetical protein
MNRNELLDARLLALVDLTRDAMKAIDDLPSIEANSSTERCVRLMEASVADLFDQCRRLKEWGGAPTTLGEVGA